MGGVCPRLSSASTGECASAACVRVCEHASDCRVSAEVWHTPSPWERASVCRCPMLVGGSDTAWTRVRRQSVVWGGAWSVSYLPNRGCGLWLVRQASASHSSAKPFAHSPPSGVRAHAIPAHNVLEPVRCSVCVCPAWRARDGGVVRSVSGPAPLEERAGRACACVAQPSAAASR